jgi:hypothetical protein
MNVLVVDGFYCYPVLDRNPEFRPWPLKPGSTLQSDMNFSINTLISFSVGVLLLLWKYSRTGIVIVGIALHEHLVAGGHGFIQSDLYPQIILYLDREAHLGDFTTACGLTLYESFFLNEGVVGFTHDVG